ncbi:hypothetical protein V5O48_005652 [Marasmius crinis-equi]|uniref:HAT C-terminal dimerisation domain-containing protein n=1 Tax=Marasmius crinis-equi TaxID=585013 RepID=A0ABR3FLP7_9AGAR
MKEEGIRSTAGDFSVPDDIALSLDIHVPIEADNQATAFVAITCYYATGEGRLQERILNLCEVKNDVTSMIDAVEDTLEIYGTGVEDKTIYFMCTNDVRHDLVIGGLRERYAEDRPSIDIRHYRLQCVRHAIYLAAQEFVGAIGFPAWTQNLTETVSDSLISDGDISSAVHKLFQIFRNMDSCPVQELPGDKYSVCDATRMMEDALRHREVLEFYVSRHDELKTLQMSPADWNSIDFATKFLAPFLSAMRRPDPFGEYSTESSLFKFLRVQRKFGSWVKGEIASAPHPSLATALSICLKFLFRYHSGSSPVYVWASIFDPCTKLHGLVTGDFKEDLECIVPREELYRYINLPLEAPECDAVEWWKTHASLFPLLVPFALKILSIPGTALASEYAYSHCRQTTRAR